MRFTVHLHDQPIFYYSRPWSYSILVPELVAENFLDRTDCSVKKDIRQDNRQVYRKEP
jgi:hypothetical protein